MDFGVRGDGVADDRECVQSAIATFQILRRMQRGHAALPDFDGHADAAGTRVEDPPTCLTRCAHGFGFAVVRLFTLMAVCFLGDSETVSASGFPLLPAGQHLGYIEGFNPDNPPGLRAAMDRAFGDALKGGMKVARVQLDWPDLESAPGHYDEAKLVARLRPARDNSLAVYLLVCTADTNGLNYPKDLLGKGGKRLAGGMKPDDPLIVRRFNKLLDWLIPIARKNGVYCLSVGNEPDTHDKDDPAFMPHFLKFVGAVRDHAHAIDPDIAITYTSTCDPVLQPGRTYGKNIADAVDVLCFNLYAFGKTDGLDLKKTGEVLDGMLALARGKPVQIQELGCSSLLNPGPDWKFHKSSPEMQRRFFSWAFQKIKSTRQIRAAYVFQLVEHSPRIDRFYRDAFGTGMSADWTNNLCAWLKGLGLIGFETAEPKPAWQEFLAALKSNAQEE